MRTDILTIIATAAALTGCAGTSTHHQMLQRTGSVRVEPGPPGADYRVTILNDVDFGYDPDVPEQRQAAARGVLQAQCTKAEIVREQTIEGGRNWIGRSLRTYVLDLRCQERPAP